MTKLTVFVVGPPQSGKTAITNHLAELSESLSNEYIPTQGVRILEFERKLVADTKKNQKWRDALVDVEIWDCSGDDKYKSSWASLAPSVQAVLYIAPPDSKQGDLDTWQELFPHIKANTSLVFAHRIIAAPQKTKLKLVNKVLAKAQVVSTALDQDPDLIRSEFDGLLNCAYTTYLETKDREESMIASH